MFCPILTEALNDFNEPVEISTLLLVRMFRIAGSARYGRKPAASARSGADAGSGTFSLRLPHVGTRLETSRLVTIASGLTTRRQLSARCCLDGAAGPARLRLASSLVAIPAIDRARFKPAAVYRNAHDTDLLLPP